MTNDNICDGGFEWWMRAVDDEITKACGLTSDDLADPRYKDLFNDGCTPADAARQALENEGFPFMG